MLQTMRSQISITDKQGKETQFLVEDDMRKKLQDLAAVWGCTLKVIREDK